MTLDAASDSLTRDNIGRAAVVQNAGGLRPDRDNRPVAVRVVSRTSPASVPYFRTRRAGSSSPASVTRSAAPSRGSVRVRHSPASIPACSRAASTASSAIRR